MAFNSDSLTFVSDGVFEYTTTDAIGTVTAAGYFERAAQLGIDKHDFILVTISGTNHRCYVTGIEADGGATVQDQLASDVVTSAMIADNAVGSDQIAAGAVDTSELAAGAVTTAKIATSAVTTAGLGLLTEETAANIADVGNAINTTGKKKHQLVFDTTNTRIMISSGTAADDPWYVVDGSVTVTPA